MIEVDGKKYTCIGCTWFADADSAEYRFATRLSAPGSVFDSDGLCRFEPRPVATNSDFGCSRHSQLVLDDKNEWRQYHYDENRRHERAFADMFNRLVKAWTSQTSEPDWD